MNNRTKNLSTQIRCRLPISEIQANLSFNFSEPLQAAFPFDISGVKLTWIGNVASIIGSTNSCSIVGKIEIAYPDISISIKIPESLAEMIDFETVSEELRTRVDELFPKLPQ